MSRLPRVAGRRAVAAFERAGRQVARQRGSHVGLTKPGPIYALSIPDQPELGPVLLRALLRKADLTVEQFVELLAQL